MATVNDILIRVRRNILDMQKIKFQDSDLIDACNDAIEMVSLNLIEASDPEMIKTITMGSQVNRPADFIKFIGNHPVYTVVDNSGNVLFKHLDDEFSESIVLRYFGLKPKITALTDTIPFSKLVHQASLVDQIVSILPK